MVSSHRRLLPFSVIFAVLFLLGCAHNPLQVINEEKIVLLERVRELWKASADQDIATIAKFVNPKTKGGDTKFLMPNVSAGTTFRTENFHIEAIEIAANGEEAIIYLTKKFVVPPSFKPRTIKGERIEWEKVEGVWYPKAVVQPEKKSFICGRRVR